MRGDDDRRIPVETLGRFARLRLGPDIDDLTGRAIEADQIALLPAGIGDVRIARLDIRLVTVTEEGDFPVGIADAVTAVRPRGTHLGIVVLGAAIDVVERLGVIQGNVVELGDRQVGNEAPGGVTVEGLIEPAIRPEQHVVFQRRVEADRVVVHVLSLIVQIAESRAAIRRDLRRVRDQDDAIEMVRVSIELLVIVRTGPAGDGV